MDQRFGNVKCTALRNLTNNINQKKPSLIGEKPVTIELD